MRDPRIGHRPPAPPPAPRLRTAAAVLRLLAKLALVFGGVTLAAGLAAVKLATTGGDVPVPSLTGVPFEQAESLLRKQRLHPRTVWKRPHENAPAGTVLWQKPEPGTRVRRERNIHLGLSAGPDAVPVPDLAGQGVRQAELLLRQSGLVPGPQARVSSPGYESETIVGQTVSPGVRLRSGGAVGLLVNAQRGTVAFRMPDLVGRRLPDANRLARRLSLVLAEVSPVSSPDAVAGRILTQSPHAGVRVTGGDPVRVSLAALPEGDRARLARLRYEVPAGGGSKRVRVLVVDECGLREAVNEILDPGAVLERSVTVQGEAAAEIHLNGVFTAELPLRGAPAQDGADDDRR